MDFEGDIEDDSEQKKQPTEEKCQIYSARLKLLEYDSSISNENDQERKKQLNRERCRRYRLRKKLSKLDNNTTNEMPLIKVQDLDIVNDTCEKDLSVRELPLVREIKCEFSSENNIDSVMVEHPKMLPEIVNKNKIERKKQLNKERCRRYRMRKKLLELNRNTSNVMRFDRTRDLVIVNDTCEEDISVRELSSVCEIKCESSDENNIDAMLAKNLEILSKIRNADNVERKKQRKREKSRRYRMRKKLSKLDSTASNENKLERKKQLNREKSRRYRMRKKLLKLDSNVSNEIRLNKTQYLEMVDDSCENDISIREELLVCEIKCEGDSGMVNDTREEDISIREIPLVCEIKCEQDSDLVNDIREQNTSFRELPSLREIKCLQSSGEDNIDAVVEHPNTLLEIMHKNNLERKKQLNKEKCRRYRMKKKLLKLDNGANNEIQLTQGLDIVDDTCGKHISVRAKPSISFFHIAI